MAQETAKRSADGGTAAKVRTTLGGAKRSGGGSTDDGLVARLRRRHGWLDHVLRTNEAFTERYGNHYAAAITYFSVLSLFPLLMVAFSVAGFLLADNDAALAELRASIISSAPDGLGDFLATIVDAALGSRAGLGVFGLLLAFYSGMAWMTNLRDALTAQWGQPKKKQPLVSGKLRDLAALLGLGLALAVSFGLTAVGGGIGEFLLGLVGLADAGWARFLLRLATIVLALAANVLVFLWVLSQLPREKVAVRSALPAAVLAAVGFEILKQAGGIYLSSVASSPSGALFGPIIGLLVFANLVARFLLFVTAWTATARENRTSTVPPPPPAVIRPTVEVRRGSWVGPAAGAFGAGALLGWCRRRR